MVPWCEFIVIIEALDSIRLRACYTVVPNYKHDIFQYGCNKLQSVHNSLHIHIIFPLPVNIYIRLGETILTTKMGWWMWVFSLWYQRRREYVLGKCYIQWTKKLIFKQSRQTGWVAGNVYEENFMIIKFCSENYKKNCAHAWST
jgi:hypothetical protein